MLGIDIGGSGVKGAPVDESTGRLTAERFRVPTPTPATPEAIAATVAEIVRHFAWTGRIGCTYPGVVENGRILTAANVDSSWVGTDGAELLSDATGCDTTITNDADAAGIAEVSFGAGRASRGVVLLLTLGTGVGSALFSSGQLVPNTELGHLYFRGGPAEKHVSDAARKAESLDWPEWASRLNAYLSYVEILFWPDLLILGGGVSKRHEEFIGLLTTRAAVVPAEMRNNAGIVGAALAAARGLDAR